MNGRNEKSQFFNQNSSFLPYYRSQYDIVLDTFEITEEEREEIYWSVTELVQNRLEKARSV
ncbi:MAG: hypothetical protein QXY62_06210 [Candidatus Altiarchaeota archaeon]